MHPARRQARHLSFLSFLLVAALVLVAGACRRQAAWPPGVQDVPDTSAVLDPEAALRTFFVPPGYRVELVAAEPLVQDPVAVDIDADGRLWVVEMRGYMPDADGTGEGRPVGRVVVLRDDDDDGRMDRRTVYLDSLVLPRAVKVLAHGVLVAAPPYLWLTRDTDGDLVADTREVVRSDYGDPDSNPEHNANGLVWGLDNWIHSARYDGRLRLRDGRLVHAPTREVGQWGLSMDDYGRFYRNYNEDPLHVDLVDAHYYARNLHLARTRGLYEETVEDRTVWPVRPTPGVNRGYRPGVLRDDGTLRAFTSAGSPVVYRGDRLHRDVWGDVFVTEPAGNLVRRFDVTEDSAGFVHARNAYPGAEFLASTDERFRPVNLYAAPDGTLYVVDMYRGVIQHRRYVTGYLREQIRRRGLENPIGMGRIYRVVHRSTGRGPAPRLSAAPADTLVAHLAHPNGWWRDTAQRLLVERSDTAAAPALRRLFETARDDRTRLHALWTLDGLGAAGAATLARALADSSSHVRAAAVRIAEPWLAAARPPLTAAVTALADDAPAVRRQLAASFGVLPEPARAEALRALLARHAAADPVVVDAALSGLAGAEAAFLDGFLADSGAVADVGRAEVVRLLAAAVVRAAEPSALRRLFGWIGDASRPRAQRLALLAGLETAAPTPRAAAGGQRLPLPIRPDGLLAARGDAVLRERIAAVTARLDWPGRPPDPARPPTRPLTPGEQQRFDEGRRHYLATCAPCHQAEGQGLPGVARPLAGSPFAVGRPDVLVRIVLHGKEGAMLMPPLGATLSDEQVAALLTYVRRAWGHQATPVDAALVHEVRGQYLDRRTPWTEAELE